MNNFSEFYSAIEFIVKFWSNVDELYKKIDILK